MTNLAHGVGQSQDLPLPLDLVLQAGAATVVVSFLIVAVWWKQPRLSDPSTFRPVRPRRGRLPVRVLVFALSVFLVGNAFLGPRGPENPAAHALFVWLWVGLIPVSVLAGPVWREINPLRTLFHLLRLPAGGLRPVADDRTLGRWPAAVTLLAFVWFELVAPHRSDPVIVGCWLLGYTAVQLIGATLRGEEWFARGDCFEVYSDLAGRLSPLHRPDLTRRRDPLHRPDLMRRHGPLHRLHPLRWRGPLRWRNPLAGVAQARQGPGLAAFLAVWWGSTIADSASSSPAWAGLIQHLGNAVLPGTIGLVLLCTIVLVSVHRLSGGLDVTASLIPIAVAYTLAHYLTSLIMEGPRGMLLLVQQWGLADGVRWDVVPLPGVLAGVQISLILLGHVLGVVVAHDMALTAAPQRPVLATLADELPVVLLMIGYTWAGLFLLFVR